MASPDEVTVRPATVADKPLVGRLLQLYLHDFSEFEGTDAGADGVFEYPYFDNYWSEPERHPLLFTVGAAPAGFAFVRAGSPHDMAEFFILRRYRRRDVGRRAAASVLRLFPGEWQVRQMRSNPSATSFWRAAILYPFEESTDENGPLQRFVVPEPGTSQ